MSKTLQGSELTLTADPNFITLDGRKIQCYPFTVGDTLDFSAWLKAAFLTPALNAGCALPPDERAAYQRVALSEAKQIDFFSTAAKEIQWSSTAKMYALGLAFRQAPKPPTGEELRDLF